MPTRRTEVWDVRGGQGIEVHGGGIFIPHETKTLDPLPGVRSRDHRGVYDGTLLSHSHYGTGNRLEPVASQLDIALPAGIRCDLSAVKKSVPLPLSRLPGVLSHEEWIALALKHPSLGG